MALAAGFLLGFCTLGCYSALGPVLTELYPTEIRSTGVGVELGVGRLGGILGPYVGGWLQQAFPGPTGLFAALTAAAAISALALLAIPRAQGSSRAQ